MLQRVAHPNTLITYQSPLLQQAGIVHAFSTRIGGVSSAPFDALNLGHVNSSGNAALEDAAPNIAENYRRLQAALRCSPLTLRAWVHQVHGNTVEIIRREPENEYAETLEAEIRDRYSGQLPADSLISLVSHVLLTVRTADCVPILIASEDGRAVAAVHAGWRGIVANILANTIRAFGELGFTPNRLIAAIGPSISQEHFEVGEEVAAEFQKQNLTSAIHPTPPIPGQKPHIDLQAAIHHQLLHAGITHDRIDTNTLCTYRDSDEFFSHRRDHGITGRMAAAIQASANS